MSLSRTQARTAAVWVVFGAALIIATKPVWGFLVFGSHPTLEDLLQLRCAPWR